MSLERSRRRDWAFDCQVCGDRILPKLDRQKGETISGKLVDRARHGAGVLGRAVMSGSARQLRRAMRAVTFAMGLKAFRGDPAFALQSPGRNVRLFCPAAIAAAQSRPLEKVALCTMDIDDHARLALLRAYENEPRLLAIVDQIVRRIRPRSGA